MNKYEDKRKLVYSLVIVIFIIIVVGWIWWRPHYTDQTNKVEEQGFFTKLFSQYSDEIKESVNTYRNNTEQVFNSGETQEVLQESTSGTSTPTSTEHQSNKNLAE